MKRALLLISTLLIASAVLGREPIPVYGPARVAMDDDDLLTETILEPGVLAVSPSRIHKVYIGDGLTPGGVPIHPDGCITNFNGISVATTNLDMRSWSIKWGPWEAHGDVNEWDLGFGLTEPWLRLVRDTGLAFLAYEFTIIDAEHYRFAFNWSASPIPVLEVSTNLVEGYAPCDPSQVTYTRLGFSGVVADFTPDPDVEFYSFRVFAADRMKTGIYAGEKLIAEKGVIVTNGSDLVVAHTNGHTRLQPTSVAIQEYDTHDATGVTASLFLDPNKISHQLKYNYWEYLFPSNSGTLALKEDIPDPDGFIPKWPTWYKLGSSDTNETPDAASSSGLFSTFLGGMFLQSRNASLRLRARGDGLSAPASVEISSERGGVDISAGNTANLSAKSFTVTSTVATSGITLTNSAAGDFTVTWNGLTLSNWTDLAQWFIPKWPSMYKFGNAGDEVDSSTLETEIGLFRYVSGIYLQNAGGPVIINAAAGPTTPFRPPNVEISAAGDIMLSSTNISLGNGRVSAGNISANSIAIGTNDVGEAVASVERRIAQLQNDTCTLFWATSNGGLNLSQNSYLLPTNFPTPKLTIYVFHPTGKNITIDLSAWNPERDVQIDVVAPRAPRSSDNALNFLLIGNPVYTHSSYSGVYFRYSYSLDAGRWFTASWTMSSATTATGNAAPDGTQYTTDGTYLADAPATVAGWLALHPEWATP